MQHPMLEKDWELLESEHQRLLESEMHDKQEVRPGMHDCALPN
jgi:hypothetical protein